MARRNRRHKRVLNLVRRILEENPKRRMTARQVQMLIFDIPVKDRSPTKCHRRMTIPTPGEIAGAMRKLGLGVIGKDREYIRGHSQFTTNRNVYESVEESV